MLSRFSVKKPYTVVVGVILILILGFVSFTKMTTDLLPDMNLPYAIVVTPYPGASPSEVEEVVTKPVESAMATVSNIENIQSVSQENMSMVILQFSQSANMDSVSLEMRENLDQTQSSWEEGVESPIIMKLNPEMMPVMVAAVEKEGLDSVELSDLTNREILSDLESLEGVASVSASGIVEESIQVLIREEKIDKVNDDVQAAVNEEFAQGQQKLDDAKAELESSEQKMREAKEELAKGREQLDMGRQELIEKLPQAQAQLDDAKEELLQNKEDLEQGLKTVDLTLQVLEESLKSGGIFDQTQAGLDQAYRALDVQNSMEQLTSQKESLQSGIEQMDQGLALLAKQSSQLEAAAAQQIQTGLNQAAAGQMQEARSQTQEDANAAAETLKQLATQKVELESQRAEAVLAMGAVDVQMQALQERVNQLNVQQEQLNQARAEAEAQRTELQTAKHTMESYLQQIEQGEMTMDHALVELNRRQLAGTIDMAAAQTQVTLGEAQLEQGKAKITSGKEQMEQGQKELDEQREKALQKADVTRTVTADMVSQILTAQNFSMPAGYVTEDHERYLIRVGDRFQDAEELKDLILFDLGIDGIDPIKLSDVADVSVVDNSSEVYASVNGQPGVLLTMQKQTGYATSEVSDRILAYFEKAQQQDKGLHFSVLMDQGIYIDMVVEAVLNNLMYGAVLAVIILYLFLRDVRPTFVVACSIPISVMTALVLMYFSGITMNIISLSGLALGVGMLVDNSIVVIENIYRLRELGYSRKKAAVAGAGEVGGAIVASTLTTVCVFLPIVFTEGITKQLFVDMGLTIAYSLLASLLAALTLVPMISAGLLKKEKQIEHKIFDRFLNLYGTVMEKVLRFKPLILLGALGLLVLSGWLCLSRGMIYIPEMESTQASVNLKMPKGSTLEETGEMAGQVMERLEDLSDIESIGAMAGGDSTMALMGMGGGSGSGSEEATMYLILKEDKELSGEELTDEILERTADLNCEVQVTASSMDMSALGSSGIAVEIKGKDSDKLQQIAAELADKIEKVPGTKEVLDGQEETAVEERLVVNKKKASEYNLTVAQVFQQIAAKLAEKNAATVISTDVKDYDVDVVDENAKGYTRSDLKRLKLTYTNLEGEEKEVPITKVVDFVKGKGMTAITREDQSRYLQVTASIDDGYNVTRVADEVNQILKTYQAPAGYTVEMTGEDEMIMEAMAELMKMLLLAVVFIYLIMVAQFQSLLSPFIVMFTIPLAFTGGFLGLVLTGLDLSIVAMIGFVMLSGIIVNNGIVLVDYINQLRREGMEKRAAIIKAGKTRMRPIMMTALTTILGLTTMAAGVGAGAEMMQGMAMVTIGGLLYGTVLTLFVVPCIYDLLNRKAYKKEEEDLETIGGGLDKESKDEL